MKLRMLNVWTMESLQLLLGSLLRTSLPPLSLSRSLLLGAVVLRALTLWWQDQWVSLVLHLVCCRFILLLVGGLGEPDCVDLQQPEFVPQCGRHNEAGVGMSLVNTDPELHEAQHAEWPNMCAVIEKQVVI